MNEPRPRDETLVRSNEIDAICDEFEAAWSGGQSPGIEEFLDRHDNVDSDRLIRELLPIELEVRRHRGETPALGDYVERFPEQKNVIEKLLRHHNAQALAETADLNPGSTEETRTSADSSNSPTYIPGERTAEVEESDSSVEGRQLGDYELLHEIARGGMGVVYKARQISLNRIVALKMIKSGELAGEDEKLRFRTEAEAAAQLDHPNIVGIYEVGEQDGQQFFSMRFVEGTGLDERLKDGPLPPSDAAELINMTAEAVHYAHEKGIVHRDLKPANVLLEADNKPRITDFGLAKNITDDSGMTATGQVMGSPSFMPPEQAAGQTRKIGRRADVYSLGAMLYALLTGRPPFQAASIMETLKQVLEKEPVSPRVLNPSVDRDLETICLKALEKNRENRYATARALANDLRNYLDNKPITARPIGRLARSWRWCKRNPLGASMLGLLVTLALVGPAIAANQMRLSEEAQRQRKLTQEKVIELNRTNKSLAASLQAEKSATRLASANAKRAMRNLRSADEVVKKFLLQIGKEDGPLSRYPATQPLRRNLLQMGRSYYEQLIAENPDASLSPRLADANFQLAVLLSQLSGTKAAAISGYEKALRQYQDLVTRFPTNREHKSSLAKCHNNLGLLYHMTGKTKLALNAFLRAAEIREKLIRERATLETRVGLSLVLNNIAITHQKSGQRTNALNAYRRAAAIQEEICREAPEVAEYQRHLAASYSNLALLDRESGKRKESLVASERVNKIFAKLNKDHPKVTEYRELHAGSLRNLATLYSEVGEAEKSLAAFDEALKIIKRLAAENPTVAEYQDDLAATHNNLGNHLYKSRRYSRALQEFQSAVDLWNTLVKKNPAVTDYQEGCGHTYGSIGLLYEALDRKSDAVTVYLRAISILEPLVRREQDLIESRIELSRSEVHIGRLYRYLGRSGDSRKYLNRAVRRLSALRKRDSRNSKVRVFLRNAHSILALTLADLGLHTESVVSWRKAIDLHQGSRPDLYFLMLSRELARSGAHSEGTNIAEKLLKRTRNPHDAYLIACTYSNAVGAVHRDETLSSQDRSRLVARYSRQSGGILYALRRSGYFRTSKNRRKLQVDRDLDPIRDMQGFSELCKSLGVKLPVRAVKPNRRRKSEVGAAR